MPRLVFIWLCVFGLLLGILKKVDCLKIVVVVWVLWVELFKNKKKKMFGFVNVMFKVE